MSYDVTWELNWPVDIALAALTDDPGLVSLIQITTGLVSEIILSLVIHTGLLVLPI